MPTERLAFLTLAVGIALTIVLAGRVAIPPGWDKAVHFAVFSALTFCLWQATAGEMPLVVLAGAIAFGAIDEMRQAYLPGRVSDAKDLLADAAAVLVTGTLLLLQRNARCAESSPR